MKGNCPRLMRLLAVSLLAVLALSPLAASASSLGTNAFVPNANYQSSGSTTTVTGGVPDPKYVVPSGNTGTTTVTGGVPDPKYVIPSGTGTGTTTSGTQRNTNFLTPEEIAASGVSASGSRNSAYLVAGETPYIPSTSGNRAGSFLMPGETPKDINGNPLTGLVAGKNVSTTKTGTRIGNCREWVNVRASDNTKAEILGRAYLSESITILRWNDKGTWAYISYNGGNGWVSGSFIKK